MTEKPRFLNRGDLAWVNCITGLMVWHNNFPFLALGETQFDVFIKVDRNLSFQLYLLQLDIAVIVLQAPSNRLVDLKILMPKVIDVLATISKGEVTIIRFYNL